MKRTALVLALLLGSVVVGQDDGGEAPKPEGVVVLLQKGIDLYKAGKVDEAAKSIQAALAQMQKELEKSLEAFARPAPKGYTRDIKSNSGATTVSDASYAWTDVTVTYSREADGARFKVQITSMPHVQAGFRAQRALLDNPQMLAMMNQDPDRKISKFEKGAFVGMLTEEPERWNGFLVGEAVLVVIEGDKASKEVARKMLDEIDWAGLGEVDKRLAAAK